MGKCDSVCRVRTENSLLLTSLIGSDNLKSDDCLGELRPLISELWLPYPTPPLYYHHHQSQSPH